LGVVRRRELVVRRRRGRTGFPAIFGRTCNVSKYQSVCIIANNRTD
jgi:hypothetical protein